MKYATIVSDEYVSERYIVRIQEIVQTLNKKEYTIRIQDFKGTKEIISFANNKEVYSFQGGGKYKSINPFKLKTDYSARRIAAKFTNSWGYLNQIMRRVYTLNVFLLLGKELDTPSELLICSTPDGSISNTTGVLKHTIDVATSCGIKVYDVKNDFHYDALVKQLNEV